jgi:hypothetical protein
MDMVIGSSLNDNGIWFSFVEELMKFFLIDMKIIHGDECNLCVFMYKILNGAVWITIK